MTPTASMSFVSLSRFWHPPARRISLFERAIALNPKSPDLHNHLAQSIVFREMHRNGALESELVSGNNSFLRRPKLNPSPETEKWFLGEVAAAISLADASLAANPNDPWSSTPLPRPPR